MRTGGRRGARFWRPITGPINRFWLHRRIGPRAAVNRVSALCGILCLRTVAVPVPGERSDGRRMFSRARGGEAGTADNRWGELPAARGRPGAMLGRAAVEPVSRREGRSVLRWQAGGSKSRHFQRAGARFYRTSGGREGGGKGVFWIKKYIFRILSNWFPLLRLYHMHGR